MYFYDYGEPNPEFFHDRLIREDINREKRMMTGLADRPLVYRRRSSINSIARMRL